MNIVYLLDPNTNISYPVNSHDTLDYALTSKEMLQGMFPKNIFYYTANAPEPEKFYSFREALLIVNGEDIYSDVQS